MSDSHGISEKQEVYPILPADNQLCTQALSTYFRRYAQIFEFIIFSSQLAWSMDEARKLARTALSKVDSAGTPKHEGSIQHEVPENRAFTELRNYAAFQAENTCIRHADNFLSFLSESLMSAMLVRPEMLRSNETIKMEDILRFSSYEALIPWLVEKKLNELTYSGIRGIEEFLKGRTGLQITENEQEYNHLSILIELRNIYTHNRGIVNEIFMKRINCDDARFSFKKAKYFHIEFDNLAMLANNSFGIAKRLDAHISEKYGLIRKEYSRWIVS